MRCESCHGTGRNLSEPVYGAPRDDVAAPLPCPECQGSGIAHCCDGICEQPQADPEAGPAGRRKLSF